MSENIQTFDDAVLFLRGYGPLFNAVAELMLKERDDLKARTEAAEGEARRAWAAYDKLKGQLETAERLVRRGWSGEQAR